MHDELNMRALKLPMLTIRDDDYIRLNLISDFIEDFVAPLHRARLHYLLSKPKRRKEAVHDLCYDFLLDKRHLQDVKTLNADEIYAQMRKLKAPTHCFYLSFEDQHRDATNLKSALEECVGFCGGIILYCPKEKLGYWEMHECDRHILRKSADSQFSNRG